MQSEDVGRVNEEVWLLCETSKDETVCVTDLWLGHEATVEAGGRHGGDAGGAPSPFVTPENNLLLPFLRLSCPLDSRSFHPPVTLIFPSVITHPARRPLLT